jgi:hypothetical protein
MSEYFGQHWIISLVATIALGAIGSGLWDVAVKPYSARIGNAVFSAITLGAKSARDRIYKDAALGHHEMPSLYILAALVAIPVALVVSSLSFAFVTPVVLQEEAVLEVCKGKSEAEKKECVREKIKSVLPTIQMLSFVILFLSVPIFYLFHKVNRANLLTTYYHQSLKAIRPYIDESRLHLIEQKVLPDDDEGELRSNH